MRALEDMETFHWQETSMGGEMIVSRTVHFRRACGCASRSGLHSATRLRTSRSSASRMERGNNASPANSSPRSSRVAHEAARKGGVPYESLPEEARLEASNPYDGVETHGLLDSELDEWSVAAMRPRDGVAAQERLAPNPGSGTSNRVALQQADDELSPVGMRRVVRLSGERDAGRLLSRRWSPEQRTTYVGLDNHGNAFGYFQEFADRGAGYWLQREEQAKSAPSTAEAKMIPRTTERFAPDACRGHRRSWARAWGRRRARASWLWRLRGSPGCSLGPGAIPAQRGAGWERASAMWRERR